MNKKDFTQQRKTKSLLTEDRQEILYDHYQNGAKNLIIIAHGFFNSKNSTLLQDLGQELWGDYDVILMDFRGHGQSKGLFYWTTKEYIDLIAVLKRVKDQYEKIGVIGFSLGAATSIITASKIDWINTLILVSAPTEFEKIEFHFWDLDVENDILYNLIGKGKIGKGVRPGPFWLPKEKPVHLIAQVKSPILFLHGEADWLIRPWHSQTLHEKAKGQKEIVIIKNGPHAEYLIRKNKRETVKIIKDWLTITLQRGHQ